MVRRYEEEPWSWTVSRRGYACDELVSALHKYVRRGNTEESLLIAREMCETSQEMVVDLWDRLVIIASADVGGGNFLAPVVVETLRSQCLRTGHYGWLFVAHAVRFLCEAPKDTTTEEMCMWTNHVISEGTRLPQIPDYALDSHTRRGREMNRGFRHFFDEGCLVDNEVPGRDTTYRQRVLDLVARGEWKE